VFLFWDLESELLIILIAEQGFKFGVEFEFYWECMFFVQKSYHLWNSTLRSAFFSSKTNVAIAFRTEFFCHKWILCAPPQDSLKLLPNHCLCMSLGNNSDETCGGVWKLHRRQHFLPCVKSVTSASHVQPTTPQCP
jgi:hypothetical protein